MKAFFSNKLVLIIAAAVIAAGGFALYGRTSNDTTSPVSSTQQDVYGEADTSDTTDTDSSVLRDDLPLYPGVEHSPVDLARGAGHYRWNVEVPESDMAVIAEDIKQLASDKGWELVGETAGSVSHELGFKQDGDMVTVTVRADGADKRPVYYEFMTAEFMAANGL